MKDAELAERSGRIFCALTAFAAVSVLLSSAALRVFRDYNAANLAVYSLSMAAAIVIANLGSRVGFGLSRPRGFVPFRALVFYLASCFAGGLLGSLAGALCDAAGVRPVDSVTLPSGTAATVLFALGYVLLPALLEELLFRGVILRSLREWGDGFAIGASSVVFALSHASLTAIPPALVFGLFAGALTVKTGSALPAMLFHAINNATAMAALLLEANDPGAYDSFASTLTLLFLLSALAAGAYAMFSYRPRERGEKKRGGPAFFLGAPAAIWLVIRIFLIILGTEAVK